MRAGEDVVDPVAGAVGRVGERLGWYGVSHTTRQWRQTPYLVSGGILGLGLIFIGGFAYFSYWMTRMVEETRVRPSAR